MAYYKAYDLDFIIFRILPAPRSEQGLAHPSKTSTRRNSIALYTFPLTENGRHTLEYVVKRGKKWRSNIHEHMERFEEGG